MTEIRLSRIIFFMLQRITSSFSALSVVCKQPLRRLAIAVFCGVGPLLVAGCGGGGDRPALGRVHGRVTMDGKPLAQAAVGFQPKAKGRESTGRTDSNGEFDLTYLGDVKGAGIGENSVRVTTQKTNDPRTESVPAKYNKLTTLRFEVKAGTDNVANFDLMSR